MNYTRKKEPLLVRRAILDKAIQIAASQGYANVTVQAVSKAAGVTKGGLFHHFPSKSDLVEEMFNSLMEKLDNDLNSRILKDEVKTGRFTRSYVNSVFESVEIGRTSMWSAIGAAMMGDPHLRKKWESWLANRIRIHIETDNRLQLDMARLAADGAWIAGDNLIYDFKKMHAYLLSLTFDGD